MPLQKQNVPLPLTALDQRVDEKNAPVGTLDLVENAYREQAGEFRKRSGSSVLDRTCDSGSITTAQFAGQLNDAPFLLTGSTAFARSTALAKWVNKGSHITHIHSSAAVYPSGYRQGACDVIYYSGFLFWAWEEWGVGTSSESGDKPIIGIFYAVTDATTGQVIVSRTSVAAPSGNSYYYKPKWVQVGTSVIVFYERPTNYFGQGSGGVLTWDLMGRRIAAPTTAPGTLGTETTVVNIGTTGNPITNLQTWDVMVYSGEVKIVYRHTSNVFTKRWLEDMTTGGASVDMGVAGNANAIAWLSWDGSDGSLYFANGLALNQVNATTLAATTVAADTTTINNVTGYVTSASSFTIFYDVLGSHKFNTVTTKRTFSAAGTAGTATTFARSLGIASKVFKVNDLWNIMLTYQSVSSVPVDSNQSVHLQFDIASGKVIGKPLPPGLAAEISRRKSHLPSGAVISASKTVLPMQQVIVRDFLDGYQGAALFNIFALTIDTPDARLSQPVNAGQVLIFPGAQPKMFDTATLTEVGFHYAPEKPAVTASAGVMDNGTYTYKYVYEWADGTGRLHRSAPSAASASITTATQNVNVTATTLRVTDKTNVNVVLYRQDGNGIYHKVKSGANTTSADTFDLLDTMTQADAARGETLYTTGNALENIAPPACTIVGTGKGRVWFGGTTTGEFWYSKEVTPGLGVECSDFLVAPNQDGAVPTAFGELDDKMAVFYEDAVCVAFGEGPNNLGQGDFTIQKVTANSGTTKPRTVLSTPVGVPFLSKDGWRILSRGLSVEPFGQQVQDYDTNTYTGAVVVPARSHAMWFTSDGRTLVYDWMFQQWYTFTGQTAVAAFMLGNVYAHVSSTGVVSYEVDQQFHDNSTAIAQKFRYTWLNFAGLAGYQRIYAIQAVGEYVGAHTLRAVWEFDFDTATTYTYNVTPSANPYRFETRPPQQRCTTARVTVQEVVSGTTGGFKLSGLTAVVGIETGHKPVASSARAT